MFIDAGFYNNSIVETGMDRERAKTATANEGSEGLQH
jgi:hypothetical protein